LLIIVNSTGSVKYVLCTERCLPTMPGRGSGARAGADVRHHLSSGRE
jgi:hypothetical protein